MKLCFAIILAASLQVSAKTYSQEKITVDFRNVKLDQALKEIEQKSDYRIAFSTLSFSRSTRITFQGSNLLVNEVLDTLLNNSGLRYQMMDNKLIVITKAEESAPARTITGKVTDEKGTPLAGVTVQVRGSEGVTTTAADGSFSIEVPDNAKVLIFSYVGMEGQEVDINGKTSVQIKLVSSEKALDDVVVIGFGTQSKRSLVGSVGKITSKRIEGRPIASAEQALIGLTPGLNVAQPGSSPGDLATINIRGIGSISAGYSPLFVIDGFPTDQRNFAAINPRDIESIEVLKDASATAIYGSRGANGVILVTTKEAKNGRSQITVGISTGIGSIPNSARPKLLNAQEYVQYYKESFANRNLPVPNAIANWDGKTNTNWQDVVYQNGAFQDYSISASGGAEKVNYLLSGNYIDQVGTVIGEGQKKYSLRMRVDYNPTGRIKLGMMIAPNITNIERSSPAPEDGTDWASLNSLAYLLPPIVPVRRGDGSYALSSDLGIPGPAGQLANPLELAEQYKRKTSIFNLLANSYAALEVTPGLILRSSIGLNFATVNGRTYYAPTGPRFTLPNVSTLNLSKGQEVGWLSETTVNYKKAVRDHVFEFLGGYTAQQDQSESLNGNVSSLAVAGPLILSIGDRTTLTATNGVTKNVLLSTLGRANYSFKNKYLFTANVRRDGSSRFGANNRYKTFWSAGGGWILSDESFMRGVKFLSSAKIRGSYGTTGSNSIPDFIARPSLTPANQAFGNSLVIGAFNGDPGNAYLTWETSQKLDIGADLYFFQDRLSLIVDYYNNTTKDLLLTKSLPLSSGFAGTLTNIGSMVNKGIELSINANVLRTKEWNVTIGGNVTRNSQEVTSLGGPTELFNFFGALRTVVGGELQRIRGVKAIGVVRPREVIPSQPNVVAGDIKFEDYDKNGSISDFLGGDGQLLGDPNLDWLYGFNTSVRFKNFELFALFNGQAGGSVYDFYLIQVGTDAQGVNLSKKFWYDGRYISENQPGDGKTPRAGALQTGNAGVGFVSSLGVQKTDYLRVRNLTLSYNIPASGLKYGLKSFRLFTSVENLYTFTKFIGGNPDARRNSIGGPGLIGGSRIGGTYDGRELALTSVPSLPLPRTWTIGLNITF